MTESQNEMITAIQFRRAQALARAHSHEWSGVAVDMPGDLDPYQSERLALVLPAPFTEVRGKIENFLGDRDIPGLDFSTTHTTGSGRLTWEVYSDGSVRIEVRRPGSKLLALRSLAKAAKEVWYGVSELQPLLQELAGDLTYNSCDHESPLGQAIDDLTDGVTVLAIATNSDSTIGDITETTRWDVTDDNDAVELRHWVVAQEALAAIGVTLAQDQVRPEVWAALTTLANARQVITEAEKLPSGDLAPLYEASNKAYAASIVGERRQGGKSDSVVL